MDKIMFSSKSDRWETPQDFFDKLDAEFHFNLDACADESNYKCNDYFTEKQNGLLQNWVGRCVFCNPPYGNKNTGIWVKKCYEEGKKPGTTVVLLMPARTDTAAFHDYIYNQPNVEIRFIRGRLKFGGKDRAPFPSMVVVFRGAENQ